MGRHPWTNRMTVEQCPFSLCAGDFHRAKALVQPPGTWNTISWTRADCLFPLGKLNWQPSDSGASGRAIYIPAQNSWADAPVDEQKIKILTTRPYFGGKRLWFQCGCGRRVLRLYLPPGKRVFKCRGCYNLTHRSAQTHDQRKYDLARSEVAIDEALHDQRLGRQLLGVGAFTQRYRWFRSGRLAKYADEEL